MSLSYHNRPKLILSDIDYAYNKISSLTKSGWGLHNGHDVYGTCGIKSINLVINAIKNNPLQKEFYVMDIGAGNFQFNQHLATLVNEASARNEIPADIKVNIIGVRGEKNLEQEINENGICKIYNFGNFKIEYLRDELNN